MNKVHQLKEAARQQVFSACELLYKRGARTVRDFSVRKIREVKMELFGVGGKFNTIPGYRDEWLEQAGLIGEKGVDNGVKSQNGALDKNQSLEDAFNDFVKHQANKLAGEYKVNLEKKVADQDNEIENLKSLLEDKKREIEGFKKNYGSMGDTFNSIAESKAELLFEKKKNKDLEEQLSTSLSNNDALQAELKAVASKLKEKTVSCDDQEENLARFYHKFVAMEGDIKALKTNKAILENQYKDALQDLSLAEKELQWFKEKEKEKRDELNQNLYYAKHIIDKLGDK